MFPICDGFGKSDAQPALTRSGSSLRAWWQKCLESEPSRARRSLRDCDRIADGWGLMGEIHPIMSTMSLITISRANKKLRIELEA